MLLLHVRAYHRRRAFAAWFAGAPAHFQDVSFDALLGLAGEGVREGSPPSARPQAKVMSPEAMMHNLKVFAARQKAAVKARAKTEGE